MKKLNKRLLLITAVCSVIFVFGVSRFYKYVDDYYQASEEAWDYINSPVEGVTVDYVDNTIVFMPDNPKAGIIFYPGGLVQTEAYAPLMEQLAEQDIMCVLVEMPYYLAIFDANGARGIQDKYPDIDNWYLAGHSLGGSMASLYANRHQSEYEGVILLASYSTKDLSDEPALDALCIYGSEDGVLNMDKYLKNCANLPNDYEEIVIKGGCHSYFGDYGSQYGDGDPTITVEEQIEITVNAIDNFVDEHI